MTKLIAINFPEFDKVVKQKELGKKAIVRVSKVVFCATIKRGS